MANPFQVGGFPGMSSGFPFAGGYPSSDFASLGANITNSVLGALGNTMGNSFGAGFPFGEVSANSNPFASATMGAGLGMNMNATANTGSGDNSTTSKSAASMFGMNSEASGDSGMLQQMLGQFLPIAEKSTNPLVKTITSQIKKSLSQGKVSTNDLLMLVLALLVSGETLQASSKKASTAANSFKGGSTPGGSSSAGGFTPAGSRPHPVGSLPAFEFGNPYKAPSPGVEADFNGDGLLDWHGEARQWNGLALVTMDPNPADHTGAPKPKGIGLVSSLQKSGRAVGNPSFVNYPVADQDGDRPHLTTLFTNNRQPKLLETYNYSGHTNQQTGRPNADWASYETAQNEIILAPNAVRDMALGTYHWSVLDAGKDYVVLHNGSEAALTGYTLFIDNITPDPKLVEYFDGARQELGNAAVENGQLPWYPMVAPGDEIGVAKDGRINLKLTDNGTPLETNHEEWWNQERNDTPGAAKTASPNPTPSATTFQTGGSNTTTNNTSGENTSFSPASQDPSKNSGESTPGENKTESSAPQAQADQASPEEQPPPATL